MVKNCLNKGLLLLLLLLSFSVGPIVSADSYSELFIIISDAQTALQEGDNTQLQSLLEEFQTSFSKIEQHSSTAGQEVSQILEELQSAKSISKSDLTKLSKALLAFEEEQNPLDVAAEKEAFQKKVYPAFENLKKTIETGNVEEMKTEYLTFNAIWTRNESIVRQVGDGHYGNIETAMSLLRVSIETEPYDAAVTQSNLESLKTALDDFMSGKTTTSSSGEITTLAEGIAVLKEAYEAFQSGDTALGQEKMKAFISNWTTFEWEVSTRSSALYSKVETQTPLIMAKGNEKSYQEALKQLISELEAITEAGSYSMVDAMLILLREGFEALLVVMALVGILKAGKQTKGIRWVYFGAITGVAASLLVAFLLQWLFPAASSGTNREVLEGFVGLVAVVMMIGVGIWLHSKSNVKAWNAYMERQMQLVMSTGSFVSMFALSFLAVFREGAETILFYVGILPHITMQNFLLGIGLAIFILFLLGLFLSFSTTKLPVHLVFRFFTWAIYLLAFKMLGVSIHALQLTGILPNHAADYLPSLDIIGLYPSLEVFFAQVLFVVFLLFLYVYQARRQKNG